MPKSLIISIINFIIYFLSIKFENKYRCDWFNWTVQYVALIIGTINLIIYFDIYIL